MLAWNNNGLKNDDDDDDDDIIQRQFVTNNIHVLDKKRKHPGETGERTEKGSSLYNLNGSHVCKKVFLNTLGVSERFMQTAIEKGDTERGVNGKDGKQKVIAEVKTHIKSFPIMYAHYVGERSKRN